MSWHSYIIGNNSLNIQDHIIRYIDSYYAKGQTFLVMEYCESGSLIDEAARSSFNISEIYLILKQLSLALEYTHERKIVHRDIKPANILVKSREPLHVVLADFGLASAQESFLSTICGTELYLAPEIYGDDYSASDNSGNGHGEKGKQRPVYWEAVDMWSLGVVGLEYSHGLPAKSERVRFKIAQAMTRKAANLLTKFPSDDFVKLLSQMLQQDPWDRPAARECSKALDAITCRDHSHDLLESGQNLEPTMRVTTHQASVRPQDRKRGRISSTLTSSDDPTRKRKYSLSQQSLDGQPVASPVLFQDDWLRDENCVGSSIARMVSPKEWDSSFDRWHTTQTVNVSDALPPEPSVGRGFTESEICRLLQEG